MDSFVNHRGWILSFFTVLVIRATCSPIQPRPIQVTRTDGSNSCKATLLQCSGRWAYENIGDSVTFWVKFSLPSLVCAQNVSFSWSNSCQQVVQVVSVQESDNSFFSNHIVKNISEADYGAFVFKVSDQTLQSFYISPQQSCHDKVPNATCISKPQIHSGGSTVTLTCGFLGDSSSNTTNIKWYHNETYINDPDHHKFNADEPCNLSANCTFSHSLIINNATRMESGSYKCLAVDGSDVGTSKTTNLVIVPLPVIFYEHQLSCEHCRVSMQWKVTGYSNHTLIDVEINGENFTEYKYNISTFKYGSILYTVNITESISIPAGDNKINLCAHFDSDVIQRKPPYRMCSSPVVFTVSNSKFVYYWLLGVLPALLIVVVMIIILTIYVAKHYRKKKGYKEEMTESTSQPLLPSDSTAHYSFYDSVQSWPFTSSIMRVAQKFTTSVSARAFGHKQDDGPKMVFILYCKPRGSSGNSHVNDVEMLAECLDLGSHNFRCEFDGWHNGYVAVWSNWTLKMINRADFVILVCTNQFCRVLSQEMGETFETCRGTVSSAAVTNLLSTNCHKFIPVFLNTKVKRKSIPPALLSTTAYELNLKELDTYIAENGEQLGKKEAMHRYLADELPSMEGLICLLKLLRGER